MWRRVVDVHGHSLSLYTGAGTRRHTAHDIIVRKLESILKFAGQHDIVAEDADVFKWCIRSEARRRRYAMAMGARNTRRDASGLRPDLSAQRYRFARSAMGPSQHQLWDVKTVGASEAYHANFRVPPADQRARGVPGDYRRAAVECDRAWNGTLPGTAGAFEGYLASLPPVIGLGFGPFGEWSSEVDTLIGQVAEIASACPLLSWADAGARPVRALGADAPSSRGAPGGLAVPARGAGPHAPSPDGDVRGRPGALPRDG